MACPSDTAYDLPDGNMPPASRRPDFGRWFGWIMSTRRRIDVTAAGHESIAVTCLLALDRVASDAMQVHRLAAHPLRPLHAR